jgi:sec-independent protein translocase protein TatC
MAGGGLHQFRLPFMLGMGLGFELPVVILTLVKIGVLIIALLSKGAALHDRHQPDSGRVADHAGSRDANAHVRAAAGLLYEITVWIAWYWDRQEKKRAARES